MCKYCRFDKKHEPLSDGLNIERYCFDYNGFPEYKIKLFIEGSGEYEDLYLNIKYCPMCGRKLNDE